MVKLTSTKKSIFQATLKRNSVHTSYSWATLGGAIGRHATAGALFIVASVLHGMRSIFTVLAKGNNSHFPFHPAAAFMMSEILALVLSLVGTMVLGRGTADLKAFKLSTFMLYSIPALLITVADEIAMVCLENMDAATFQTLSNLKIFTTTILFRVLTGVPITLEQYTALFMLFFGSCLAMANVDHMSPEAVAAQHGTAGSGGGGGGVDGVGSGLSDGLGGGAGGQGFFISTLGLAMILLYTLVSSFGSLATEILLKYSHSDRHDHQLKKFGVSEHDLLVQEMEGGGSGGPGGGGPGGRLDADLAKPSFDSSLHVKNVQVYLWSIWFSLFHFVVRAGWENIPELFEGFNGWAWVLVVNNGCMGIALSAVIFYTDSIIRLFVEGSSLMLTAVFTIIVFRLLPSVMFGLSFCIIVGSFLVFYQRQFLAQSSLMGQIRHMVTPFVAVVGVAGLVGIARVLTLNSCRDEFVGPLAADYDSNNGPGGPGGNLGGGSAGGVGGDGSRLHNGFASQLSASAVAQLGIGLPGALYNTSNAVGGGGSRGGGRRRGGRNSALDILDVSRVEQWSALCGPRSHPRRHFYAFEADGGRCLDVAGTGPIERGMNIHVDRCVYAPGAAGAAGTGGGDGDADGYQSVDADDDLYDEDRAFRQNFCFLNDSTIRPVGNLNLCVGLLSLRGSDHALGANVEIFDCDFRLQHNSAVDAQLQWVVSEAGTLMSAHDALRPGADVSSAACLTTHYLATGSNVQAWSCSQSLRWKMVAQDGAVFGGRGRGRRLLQERRGQQRAGRRGRQAEEEGEAEEGNDEGEEAAPSADLAVRGEESEATGVRRAAAARLRHNGLPAAAATPVGQASHRGDDGGGGGSSGDGSGRGGGREGRPPARSDAEGSGMQLVHAAPGRRP